MLRCGHLCSLRQVYRVPVMPPDLLLQLNSASHHRCELISGLPLELSIRLLITAHPRAAPSTTDDAELLYDAVRARLCALGGQIALPLCAGQFAGIGHCMADQGAPRDHNVLVTVEDAFEDTEPAVVAAFRRFPSHVLLPVTEQGRRVTPSSALSHNIMLHYPPGRAATRVADVLARARIGADAFRLFISYKHDDCEAAASQIFHRLAEAGFAVFLDRFVTAPGEDFVGRIMSELFDKSCVLVLETPNTTASSWVLTEVATARAFRLGLLAVDLPNSAKMLPIRERLDCTAANGGLPLDRTGTLDKARLDSIADFVRANTALQGARRRRWQRKMLRLAIRRSGVTDNGESGIGHGITAHGRRYLVVLAARPPAAQDFKRVEEGAAGTRGIMFGPLVHQLPADVSVTDWLIRVSGVGAFDEGQLLPALKAVTFVHI